jgi:hypothetical protein
MVSDTYIWSPSFLLSSYSHVALCDLAYVPYSDVRHVFDNCHLIGTGFAGAIPLFLMLGWWKQSGVLATIALVMSWFAAIVSQASSVRDFCVSSSATRVTIADGRIALHDLSVLFLT